MADIKVTGNLHPCSTCHYAPRAFNGVWEKPPGGVTATHDRQGTLWITPHTADCKGPAFTRLEEFAMGITERKDASTIDQSQTAAGSTPKEGHTA